MEASLPKGIKFFRVEWSIPCAVFHQVKCINCEKDVIVKKGGVSIDSSNTGYESFEAFSWKIYYTVVVTPYVVCHETCASYDPL